MAADKAASHGVPMPQPLEATGATLRAIVPEFGAARNPCDPTGQVLSDPDSFGKCCRALLADFGAEVVKVERPGAGDETRGFEPQLARDSAYYFACNRSKASITVNLRSPDGQNVIRELAPSMGIVESRRKG